MKITVKLFSKPIELEVSRNSTIFDVKSMIQKVENIEIDQQRLVYLKKPLEDDSKTLGDYSIKENAVMYLMIRLFVKRD